MYSFFVVLFLPTSSSDLGSSQYITFPETARRSSILKGVLVECYSAKVALKSAFSHITEPSPSRCSKWPKPAHDHNANLIGY